MFSTRPIPSRAAATRRRALACFLAVALSWLTPALWAQGEDDSGAAWQALKNGGIALLRHANAPGSGDPPDFRPDDCSTQRNLDAEGQAQALLIGKTFSAQGIEVGAVWSSAWCRAKETAELAFPKRLLLVSAFDSFLADPSNGPAQTEAARGLLRDWRGPLALVVVTHERNIDALTGIAPRPGEAVVLKNGGERLEVVGRISPGMRAAGARRRAA